ncbi:MAG: replicative DNA helicase, partial [Bacteroidales bacterium]|nr:replicative DNA helicase [Bacteroidales bacterium]
MANNSKYPPREVVVSVDYAGKVPPYSESLEETVLGQLLINEDAIPDVMNYLKPEIFFIPKHQIIFKVMDSLYREASPITLMTVIDKLNAQNELDTIGGPAYISDLTMKVSSSANVEAHTKILVEKYIQRELISVSSQICEKAFSPECELSELTDFAEKNIMTVTDQSLKKRSIQNIKDVVANVYDQVLVARDAKRTIIGLPTGFTKVDAITSGWQEGNMIVIAARPGMGKTAFVLTMLRNMAMDYGRSVAMFSLEMSCEQLATRLLVGEAELDQNKLRTGNLNETELDRLLTAKERLENAKIF